MGLRITYLLPMYSDHPIGGYKVHYQYANGLAQLGHQVTLLFPVNGRPSLSAVKWLRYVKLVARMRARRTMVTWFQIRPDVEVRIVPSLTGQTLPSADLTILTAWQTAEMTIRPNPRAGQLVQIVYDYEFWMEYPHLHGRISSALSRRDVAYIATSEVVADMLTLLGTPIHATVTAGLEDGEFGIDQPIDQRKDIVAFPLRSGGAKDMATAFRAAELIHDALPDVVIECFGESTHPDIPACIKVRGKLSISELRDLYNKCSVFFLTSRYEGWGLPAAEAMACGAAVVSTRSGGVADFLTNDRNGSLVPVGDADAVAAEVIRLLTNPSERIRLATAGSKAISSHSLATSLILLDAVLREVLDRE